MAGRPLLCLSCGTPLWDDVGPPTVPPGSDAVGVTCPGCGCVSSVVALIVDPAAATRDPDEVRQGLALARGLHLDQARNALAGAAFTVYGLSAGWNGRSWINGWGSESSPDGGGEVLRSVNLVFGLPFETPHDGGPTPVWAEIETHRYSARGSAERRRMAVARCLAFEAWQDGADLASVQQTYSADADPTDHWDPVEMNVANRAVSMRRLVVGERWWAVGLIGDATVVTLKVRGLSPQQCRLVEVTDYTPFLADCPLLG